MTSLFLTFVRHAVADLLAVIEDDDAIGNIHHPPMSCSIKTMVVPNWSLTSRMKRHISCFSSTFMPPSGSSKSGI